MKAKARFARKYSNELRCTYGEGVKITAAQIAIFAHHTGRAKELLGLR
jgi:hypothetical protein